MPAFLLNPKLWAYAVAFAVVFGAGVKVTSWKYERDIADIKLELAEAVALAMKKTRKVEELDLELSGKMAMEQAQQLEKRVLVEKEIIKEVVVYEKSPAPKCAMSPDFVRIHDASARGGLPQTADPATGTDEPAKRITDADVLRVTTENYAICQAEFDRLRRWQLWWTGVVNNRSEEDK